MFRDRIDAGRQLAKRLLQYFSLEDAVVLGIPRGGIPVAFEVAQALHLPLDILVVRKLGAPGQSELAVGAIASGGVRILNDELIRALDISSDDLASITARETTELQRRQQRYRGERQAIPIQGKTVILVDDGMATGSSMLAAIAAVRQLQPKKVVVATPVAPSSAQDQVRRVADEFVCVLSPDWFFGISEFYQDFGQTEDSEVRELLDRVTESLVTTSQRKDVSNG